MSEDLIRETLIDERTLLIEPKIELTYLSSGIFGGYVKRRGIIIRTVDPEFHVEKVREWCLKNILEQIRSEDYIVLLTAVDVKERIRIEHYTEDGHIIILITTIGFSPVACIERKRTYKPLKGTINIILLTNAVLSPQALTDLYRTITEAKVAAIVDTFLTCESRPVGTITDTVTVGAPVDDKGALTCGIATTIGNLAARMVYRSIIQRYITYFNNYLSNISINELINEIIIREIIYRKHLIYRILEND